MSLSTANVEPRKLIVLATEQGVALSWVEKLLTSFPEEQVLKNPTPIKNILGKENSAVVYNLYNGFDPDLLGAMGGTIIAGGVLILITPPFHKWPKFNDPFNSRIASWPSDGSDLSSHYIQRFITKLEQTSHIIIVTNESQLPKLTAPTYLNLADGSTTEDQAQAIDHILHQIKGNKSSCTVLEADRGRGKSTVLGMLASQLTASPAATKNILVTAPSRKTVDVIFRHAGENAALHFIAPDHLYHELPPADLLLIDEAAAIPAALLTQMLTHYSKIVFSTTVHGYEGTGRGFALRFTQQLNSITPYWNKLTLKQPIRYSDNDPLEQFLFDSLLLNAKPISSNTLLNFSLDECVYRKITPRELINNEALLRQVFGLLVLAHYQTRPTDLRYLLDGKGVSIHVIMWHKQVVATALCVTEGAFNKDLAHDIHYGKRRPRGHLVPQSLAVHAGIADAPLFITKRIMRVVVHPAIQRKGVAHLLLTSIENETDKDSIDYLSCSFGATADLLSFWHKQGFKAVRLGLSRDASSGSHSVIMMKPLSTNGALLCEKSQRQFQRYLPVLLLEPLRDLEDDLVKTLLDTTQQPEDKEISPQDQQDIYSFATGHRGYENCMLALQKLTRNCMDNPQLWNTLSAIDQTLTIEKVIKYTPWTEVATLTHLSGKKQALKKLRHIIQHIVELSL